MKKKCIKAKHKSHLRSNNIERSAVAQKRAGTGHVIQFDKTKILAKEGRFSLDYTGKPMKYKNALRTSQS